MRRILLSIMMGLAFSTSLYAQESRSTLSLGTGAFSFDLAGTGIENYTRLDYTFRFYKGLRLGSEVTFVNTHQTWDRNIPYLIPETKIEIGKYFKNIRPFLGLGVGIAIDMRSKEQRTQVIHYSDDAGNPRTISFDDEATLWTGFILFGFDINIRQHYVLGTEFRIRELGTGAQAGGSSFEMGVTMGFRL